MLNIRTVVVSTILFTMLAGFAPTFAAPASASGHPGCASITVADPTATGL